MLQLLELVRRILPVPEWFRLVRKEGLEHIPLPCEALPQVGTAVVLQGHVQPAWGAPGDIHLQLCHPPCCVVVKHTSCKMLLLVMQSDRKGGWF